MKSIIKDQIVQFLVDNSLISKHQPALIEIRVKSARLSVLSLAPKLMLTILTSLKHVIVLSHINYLLNS
jgi:hypothetical protein